MIPVSYSCSYSFFRYSSSNSASKSGADVKEAQTSKKPRQLDGYVGFANLPNQVYRKAVKKGFEFTLMVAGESGLGKSTLINSMFLTDIYSADYPGPSTRIKKTVKVRVFIIVFSASCFRLLTNDLISICPADCVAVAVAFIVAIHGLPTSVLHRCPLAVRSVVAFEVASGDDEPNDDADGGH
jgi:hypothetical protein